MGVGGGAGGEEANNGEDNQMADSECKDDKMEPPIHTEYLRSGGATTLIFIVDGARAVSSLVMRSPIPVNMVVPPESTTFAYKSLRMSTSHFMIDWKVVS